ncbi:hypothetical protein EYF80_014560 [Liparis tanakae]|uniref:Uncharacterized protein n=1 Tax=Liparis tanakae TaxID=230148 RepID=A0A4Z2IB79_9TELE|nr:hypothetical protein EYF80_014560 [Liparis tanakae]
MRLFRDFCCLCTRKERKKLQLCKGHPSLCFTPGCSSHRSEREISVTRFELGRFQSAGALALVAASLCFRSTCTAEPRERVRLNLDVLTGKGPLQSQTNDGCGLSGGHEHTHGRKSMAPSQFQRRSSRVGVKTGEAVLSAPPSPPSSLRMQLGAEVER